jgi:hypothetical protein
MKSTLIAALLGLMISATAQAEGANAAATVPGKEEPPPPDVSKLRFSPETIRLVMGFHQPKIQGCYEQFLAGRKKPIEGKVMTSFVITAEGLVDKARVERKGTTLNDRKLHDCVKSVLASLEFPKPTDGADQPIQYPFNLKAIK